MTQRLAALAEIADRFDAIVLDQWGVLHDGSTAYPNAARCLKDLKSEDHCLAVLSNSGKRAEPNAKRIAEMGLDAALFDVVMTSGEALWQDVLLDHIDHRSFFPIERAKGDAALWADGLDVTLTGRIEDADAVLLMGLPDGADNADFVATFDTALSMGTPVICTNPDRSSPRAGGRIVMSPGALAHAHQERRGDVSFYGKPHLPVFKALEAALDVKPDRLLMVGDSLEHDITGGHGAGWATAFVEGGLYASRFVGRDPEETLKGLVSESGAPTPDFSIPRLQ